MSEPKYKVISEAVVRIEGYERYDSSPVPGVGPIKGVLAFNGGLFAIRDDEAGLPRLWYSSGQQWVSVPFDGAPAPATDRAISGGLRESGEYSGVAG